MLDVYADGSTIQANPSPIGGAFAWCHVQHSERIVEAGGIIPAGWLGLAKVTNNLSELVAAVEAVESLPDGCECVLYSDSRITLHRLNHAEKWNGIPDELRFRAEAVKPRIWRVKLLAGHPTKKQLANGRGRKGYLVSVHNVWCDRIAGELGWEYAAQRQADAGKVS